MKNVKKLLKKKMSSRGGFTLMEMLTAVMILILMVLILSAGLDLSVDSYTAMTADSETELLMSSLSDVIYDELRYARDIDTVGSAGGTPGESPQAPATVITGNLKKYTSVSFGRNTVLSIKDGQLYAGGKRMLAAGAYGNGDYAIEQLDIIYDKDTCVFTVNLTIGGVDNITATTEFKIRPLNSIKAEKGGPTA